MTKRTCGECEHGPLVNGECRRREVPLTPMQIGRNMRADATHCETFKLKQPRKDDE